jgi:Putative Ig domain.
MLIASAFRFALRLVCLALIVSVSPVMFAQGAITAADGFDPNVDGNVYAVAIQSDGKILIAGQFNRIQPNGTSVVGKNNIARLLPDGRVDQTFDADVNGRITAMVLQPDGRIVIGGHFTSIGRIDRAHVARNRAARLNADGSLDESFDPDIGGGPTPEVNALAIDANGGILIGGGFTTAKGEARNRIVRFNADGSLDAAFNPNASNMVFALAVQADGKILVGGGFTTIAGQTRNRLARLNADGSLDSAFNPNFNNSVNAVAIQRDGKILVGGTFTTLQPTDVGDPISEPRFARLHPDGSHDKDFAGQAGGPVNAIAVQPDGRVLVGGSFPSLAGVSIAFAGRVHANGQLDFSFNPAPNFNVYAFGVQSDGSVVLGGGFSSLRGTGISAVPRNHVARVSSTSGLDADFRPDVNGRVSTVALQSNGQVYVGGTFTSVGGLTRDSLVRLGATGSVDPSFKANVSGSVFAVQPLASGKVVIGGNFSYVNGVPRSNYARLNADGSIDTDAFNVSVSGPVYAIVEQSDGAVVLGGEFSVVRQTPSDPNLTRNNLVRLKADTSVDMDWLAGTDDHVNSLALQSDGKLVAGGAFNTAAGTGDNRSYTRNRIARFNTNGSVDVDFSVGADGEVTQVVIQDGKIVAGGSFVNVAGKGDTTSSVRNNLVRFAATGELDKDFTTQVNGAVRTLAVQGGGLLVGGRFTAVRVGEVETERNYLLRLQADGSLDTNFDLKLAITPGHEIVDFAVSDAGILVAGAFTPNATGPLRRVARVTPAGQVDASFDADVNSAMGAQVNVLTLRADGRIMAGGAFSGIGGANSTNLARFYPDSAADSSFVPALNGPVHSIAELPTGGESIPVQGSSFAWLEESGQLRDVNLPAGTSFGLATTFIELSDGKILVGGDLTVGETRYGVVRLNTDGSLDTTFQLKTKPGVQVLALQSDGKILVGGTFEIGLESTPDTVEWRNLIRLNADGTIDGGFKQNVTGAVLAIAVQSDGKIIAGGQFTAAQNSPSGTATTGRGYIARFNADGALDTGFDPRANAAVRHVVILPDGKILIAGEFTNFRPNNASTATTRNVIARINADGTLDSLDLNPNGLVFDIARDGEGRYLLAGSFTQMGEDTAFYVARLKTDLTLDKDFRPNPDGSVAAIEVQGDKILIGGQFNNLQPNTDVFDPTLSTPRNFLARINEDGSVDGAFNPNFNGAVTRLLAHSNGSLLVQGNFTAIQPNGAILIGGSFSQMNGVAVNNVALLGEDGSVSSSFRPEPDGRVDVLLPLADGRLLIGGAFSNIAGTARNRLARFNADLTLDSDFNPNVGGGDVLAVALQPDGKLIVGGNFTSIGGGSRSYLARLNTNGTLDGSFSPNVTGAVRVLALQADGKILYTTETGGGNNQLARLNADGSADNGFNPNNNNAVLTLAPQVDGRIYVGGSFTTIGGASRNYFAALTPSGALDQAVTPASSSAGPNGAVTALVLQPDGKVLIGGLFNQVDGLGRFSFARFGAPSPVVQSFEIGDSGSTLTWTRTSGGPVPYAVNFEISTDGITWTPLSQGNRVAGTANWRVTGLSLSAGTNYFVRVRGLVASTGGTGAGLVSARTHLFRASTGGGSTVPVITSATAVNGVSGSNFFYTIAASGQPTSYAASGLPPGLSINPNTGVISGTPTQTGTFTVTISATNSHGTGTATLTIFIAATGGGGGSGQWHLLNVACLANVSGSRPLILGFVVSAESKTVLLRGVGPGLEPQGVVNFLEQPKLSLVTIGGTHVLDNTKWGGDPALAQLFAQLGEFPLDPDSTDTAVAPTLARGVYTVVMTPADLSKSGQVLAEVYDGAGEASTQQFAAMSARGYIEAGGMLTGGFYLTGDQPRRVLIRGAGPVLAKAGVTDALADPRVRVFRGQTAIAENNDWETPISGGATGAEIAAAVAATGPAAFDPGSKDAAVLLTLEPGLYTAQVTGVSANAAGTVLIEIYEVP